jgi:hypothetical protein
MQDIYSAAGVLRNGLSEIPPTKVTTSFVDHDFASAKPSPYNTHEMTTIGTFKRGCEVSFTFQIANQTMYDLDRYGLLDPLAVAWELVPLSFVVDWFINVGSFLDSLTKPFGLSFIDGYKLTYLANDWVCEYHLKADGTYQSGTKPTLLVHQKSMVRHKLVTWPYPLPYLSLDLGTSQVLSIIALVKVLT